jgi:hypothetical protein
MESLVCVNNTDIGNFQRCCSMHAPSPDSVMEQRTKNSPLQNNASSRSRDCWPTSFSILLSPLADNRLFHPLIWRPSGALPLVRPAQPDEAAPVREAAEGVVTTTPSILESLAISLRNLRPNYRLSSRSLPNRNHSSVLCPIRKSGLSRMKSRTPQQQSVRLEHKPPRRPNNTI